MKITTEEKIRLAEAIGAEGYVSFKKREVEALKEAEYLGQLKLKPTTREAVESKIGRKLIWVGYDASPATLVGVLLGVFGGFVWLWAPSQPSNAPAIRQFVQCLLYVAGAIATIDFLRCFGASDTRWADLTTWPYELPYGALLAVKEAKERGLKNFEVCYPRKWTHAERRAELLKSDPIIVGHYGDQIVEIFGWDAGKTYK